MNELSYKNKKIDVSDHSKLFLRSGTVFKAFSAVFILIISIISGSLSAESVYINGDSGRKLSGDIFAQNDAENIQENNTDAVPSGEIDAGSISNDNPADLNTKPAESKDVINNPEKGSPGNNLNTGGVQKNTGADAVKPAASERVQSWLLEAEDEGFRDQRIPGISLKKEKRVVEEINNSISPDDKELSDSKEKTGLFGLKKSTSNILVKIILIILIIGIIVLFKFRSKSRGANKVLRRFPGA